MFPYEIIYLLIFLSNFRKTNGFELLSRGGGGVTWSVDTENFMHIFSIQKLFEKNLLRSFFTEALFLYGISGKI